MSARVCGKGGVCVVITRESYRISYHSGLTHSKSLFIDSRAHFNSFITVMYYDVTYTIN